MGFTEGMAGSAEGRLSTTAAGDGLLPAEVAAGCSDFFKTRGAKNNIILSMSKGSTYHRRIRPFIRMVHRDYQGIFVLRRRGSFIFINCRVGVFRVVDEAQFKNA